MTYYIIKSGSIQDPKTAKEYLGVIENSVPKKFNLPFFILECDDDGNVIREV